MVRDLTEVAALAAVIAGAFLLAGPWALVVGGSVVLLALEVTDRGPSPTHNDRVRGLRRNGDGRRPREGSKVLR